MTNNNNTHLYTTLAQRYWSGTTTHDEELTLLFLLQQRASQGLTPDEKALLLMLSTAAESRSQHTVPVTVSQPRQAHRLRLFPIGVAAAALLAFGIGFGLHYGEEIPSPSYGYSAGAKIIDSDEAWLLAEEALSEVAFDSTETLEW